MSCEKVSIFFPNLFEAGMSNNRTYRFKSFLLNVGERQLFDGDRRVALTPKTFDVLVHLVENAGRLVHKDDLMKAVWPDSFVEEVNIPRSVHHLRKSLGQDDNGNQFIETVPTKGYRFTMPVISGEPEVLLPTVSAFPEDDAEAGRSKETTRREMQVVPTQEVPVPFGMFKRSILIAGLGIIFLFIAGLWFRGERLPEWAGTMGKPPPTNNSGAYRLYLEGKFLLDERYLGNGEAARDKFEEAIRLDPNFALAYAGKADAEWRMFTGPRSHNDIASARASMNKALSLDPDSSYAHTMLCRVYATYDWDFPAAERACLRAVQLDPKSHDARHELAMFLTQFSRHSEAVAEIDQAVALAPTSFSKRQRAIVLFYAKRYREAIEQSDEVGSFDPAYPEGLAWLWQFYAMNGDHEEALEAYLNWQEQLGVNTAASELRPVFAREGWTGVQKAIVDKFRPGDARGVIAAALHCQLGNKDKVIEFLEGELKKRTLWMIHLGADPRFDPCRDDPRFDAILKRVGVR